MAETADRRHQDADGTVMDIRRDIDQTRASLDKKFDLLERKVRGVRTAVGEAVNVRRHAATHPWTFVGLSVVAGFALGSLTARNSDHDDEPGKPAPGARWSRIRRAGTRQQSRDLMDSVKLAAGAAVTDLLLQAIRQTMPAFGKHLDAVWTDQGITATSAARAVMGGPANAPREGSTNG